MRLLVVTQYFWPEDFRINDLALELRNRGHDVTVLTGKPNYPGGKFFPGYGFLRKTHEKYEGIKIVRAPLIARGARRSWRLAVNYLSFPLFGSLFGLLFCRNRYDLIFVFEPSPITVGLLSWFMKKITGAPVMFWVQDLWPESLSATGTVRSKRVLRFFDRLVRFIYAGCDRILVPSTGFVSSVERHGVPPDRIRYFPNTAEELYKPVTIGPDAPESTMMPNGFRLVFAGNIGEAQDFPNLLSTAERLRRHSDIHFVVLGNGQKYEWVRAQIAERGLAGTFHLLGRHPVESMPRFFSLADALLVSLRKDPIFSLTIPSKVQSYLACGKPIVAALDGEGAGLVTESGVGFAAPAGDDRALAEAILKMYNLPEKERQAMGNRGLEYFDEHFQRARLIQRLEVWMSDMCEEVSRCAF